MVNNIHKWSSVIDKKEINKIVSEMTNEKKLSITYKEEPTMILLHLPEEFEGTEEFHENDDDFYVVIKGEATLNIAGADHQITEGDMIHIPAKTTHRLKRTKKGITYMVVKIRR